MTWFARQLGVLRLRAIHQLCGINTKHSRRIFNPRAQSGKVAVPFTTAFSWPARKTRVIQTKFAARQKRLGRRAALLVFVITSIPIFKTSSEDSITGKGSSDGSISFDEVQKHAHKDDCWVVIEGHVYDLTSFLTSHPGGAQAILSVAGTDASDLFTALHPSNALATLTPQSYIGPVDIDTLPVQSQDNTSEDERKEELLNQLPDPAGMFLLRDYERWAEQVLSPKAWAYYRSAADEENTFQENRRAFERYFLRPRVLKGSQDGDLETEIVGIPTSMPIFMAPTAMAKLGHPLGEINFTKAAGERGVIQAISSNSSCSVDDIFEAASAEQPLIFQLYLNKDRNVSQSLIHKVERMGAKAIIFTVDVSWASQRTLDVRHAASSAERSQMPASSTSSSVASAIGSYQDRGLTWQDISFIRENTKLPIIVKGVQSVEDVALCVEHGVQGVILSNHGGRQADYAPAPIDILYEMRSLRPELFEKLEVMLDGGIRCGADVVKALALGAKAVGVGRPLLYANGTHGQEGVVRVLDILHEEITNTMRNIGVSRIEELKPEMVGPAGPWVGWNRPLYMPCVYTGPL